MMKSHQTLLLEDLLVGLLVDAVGDLLVVLVTKAGLVGGVVDLCIHVLAYCD